MFPIKQFESCKPKNIFEDFILDAQKTFTVNREFKKVSVENLNEKQLQVYKMVEQHLNNPTSELRVIVQGEAGTGATSQ